MVYLVLIFTYFCLLNCNDPANHKVHSSNEIPTTLTMPSEGLNGLINPKGKVLAQRIRPPRNHQRLVTNESSFAHYLQSLPLKPDSAQVQFHHGGVKLNNGGYVAVVDLPIGKKDLHQCADAVMHLRADYLYHQKRYKDIHFNFTNGFQADYSQWRAGNRIRVQGNQVQWIEREVSSTSYDSFWKYLEMVFTYAGTYSLSKELKKVAVSDMQIGDVFIQGGFPGHAVIVVDMVKDVTSGKKLFLLAQSYMPAQELHILSNPNNEQLSPWYKLDFGEELATPDWLFYEGDLKRFQ